MKQKVERAVPKGRSLGETETATIQTSPTDSPRLDKKGAADLTPMNFRVPPAFHSKFKIYAVAHGMKMVDLLQESFSVFRSPRGV